MREQAGKRSEVRGWRLPPAEGKLNLDLRVRSGQGSGVLDYRLVGGELDLEVSRNAQRPSQLSMVRA